jgi:hypothetical protein
MTPGVVYLSSGRLFLKNGNGPAKPIESQFAQSIRERAFELQRRHSWKSQGRGAKFMSGGALWGSDANDPVQMKIQIAGCCRGVDVGDLYYSLQSPEISGVLLLKNGGKTEQRLLHTADFRVGHLAAQSGTGRLAMSVHYRGGATVAVMGGDGSGFAEVTQGESMDESPHWFPNENRIVFQSAGLAVNERGQYAGQGPAAIQALDLDSGEMQCLAEDAKFDFLGPQIGTDGTLYFIRRPYRQVQSQFALFRLLEDILLLPFRLIYAFFQFLNFFTMMYTGKPLSKTGQSSQQRHADMPRMMIWGNLIEARKSLMKNDDETFGLVPPSWELCRRAIDGSVEVLAKGVLSFDLEPDGGVIYSNGAAIYRRTVDGQTANLQKDAMIQQVIAIPVETANSEPEALKIDSPLETLGEPLQR